jgi:hypothetical protein
VLKLCGIALGYGWRFLRNSICDIRSGGSEREHAMKAFIAACIAVVVFAAIGLVVLNHVQEPVDEAFATSYARVG